MKAGITGIKELDRLWTMSILDIFHLEIQSGLLRAGEIIGEFKYRFSLALTQILKAELALRIGSHEKTIEVMGEDYFSHPNFFVSLSNADRAIVREDYERAGIDVPDQLIQKARRYFQLLVEQQKKALKKVFPEIWESEEDLRNADHYQTIPYFFLNTSRFSELIELLRAYTQDDFIAEYELEQEIALDFVLLCVNIDKEAVEDAIKKTKDIEVNYEGRWEDLKTNLEKFFPAA